MESIVVKGAREHNLKNIDVVIPRNKLVVITGVSGSGKSSLAFDTIYAEGQRRYVESLSAYARQFLGMMSKPDVDSIEGLSPAISIEQKTTSKNPRSTVGTTTEIYDYLRLLFARVGIAHCPECGEPIRGQSAQSIAQRINEIKGTIAVLAPVVMQKKGTYGKLLEELNKKGFIRARVNGKLVRTDEKVELDRYKKHDIEIVVDSVTGGDLSRVTEAVELALKEGGGLLKVLTEDRKVQLFSSSAACAKCGISMEEMQPRVFSFNSPFGACEDCHGLGFHQEFTAAKVIPDAGKSLADGAIAPWTKFEQWRTYQLGRVCQNHGIDMLKPVKNIKPEKLDIVLNGNGYGYEGVLAILQRTYRETESEWKRTVLEKYMSLRKCSSCEGKRLKKKSLAVRVFGKSIIDVTDLTVEDCLKFFNEIELSKTEQEIAKLILKEIRQRLEFLNNVGLSYLSLSRMTGTLSGGEAQRIRLATQIGSNLTGVLYTLDEPSIGLHQRDNDKLIETLHRLRDLGNTLVVVEHDEDTIRKADWVIDIGPGAGIHGGQLVAAGTPEQIEKSPGLTGMYLSGKVAIDVPAKRRKPSGWITVKGARQNNLRNLTVKFPAGVLTAVTGVSGSGKSTLVNEVLYKGLKKLFKEEADDVGEHDTIEVADKMRRAIIIDQSPIGRTPRSNPATYTKVFDLIRNIFAQTKDAKLKGFGQGRFSFNVKGGRCEACQGDGVKKIEMHFLADVYIQCEQCKGKRYNDETLSVRFKGKNIAEALDMTVEEALAFFENIPPIKRKLQTLNDVGLSYIKLGQSSTTLSGGEAQRIKLTRELSKKSQGDTIYILDEPTTGLHFDDVKKLLEVINRLVDKGNNVIVIEHNLDVIKCADWIIDLGPEGGVHGGQIVAEGTPEEISRNEKSHTGKYLKKHLKNN